MINIIILIPVFNHIEHTKTAVKNLKEQISKAVDINYSIVVIDDGSADGTTGWLKDNHSDVIVLQGDGNLWWSGAINLGAEYALRELNADYLLLWNNDIITEKSYFENLGTLVKNTGKDTIIGSKIMVRENPKLVWSMGGRFDPVSGKYFMTGYFEENTPGKYESQRSADWLTGMGTLIPDTAVGKTGYWDAENFPQYHGDSDFTYRAKKKGFRIVVDPSLIIYNSVEISGIGSPQNLKGLFRLMTDIRSKSNIRMLLKFYRKHAVSVKAYTQVADLIFKVTGGFIKWKIMSLFGIRKKTIREI